MNCTALRTPIRRSLLRALAALLVLTAWPAPALAHAHLQRSAPAAGARLTAVPRELVLTFSEDPTLAMSALRLLGPDSAAVALGTLGHGGGARTLTAAVAGPLAAGRYTVLWQTAGDDGHVQHGSYTFVIAEGAEGLAPPAKSMEYQVVPGTASVRPTISLDSAIARGDAAGFDVSSPAFVAIRWVQFASLLLLVGAVAFRWWVVPRGGVGVALDEGVRRELSKGAAAAGTVGAALLALSALARLAAQLATMRTASSAGSAPSVGAMLVGTPWGHGWLLEVFALAFAFGGLRAVLRDPAALLPWRVIAAAAAGLGFVPGLSGHAIADRTFAPFTELFDGAHVLAAGTWLGTLAVLLTVGLPVAVRLTRAGRANAVASMVNAFSPLALTSAAVLVF